MLAALTVPCLGRSYPLGDLTIEETVNKHDMYMFWIKEPASMPDFLNKPVLLNIDAGAESRSIPGYLDTPVSVANRVGAMEGAFFALGASSIMRSGTPRVWTDKRPIDIAHSILDPHGFGLEIENIPEALPFFSQSGDSDWQTLVRLGNENGLVTIGSGTIIRMVDPSLETRRLYRRIKYQFNIRKAHHFSASRSATPIGFERRTFIGVDKYGATFEVIANPDSPVSLHAPELVNSLGAALAAKERLERRRHSRRTATLVTDGAPLARSGTCITLQDGPSDRVWFVLAAKHEKKGKQFQTTFTLCRDDDDYRGAVPMYGNQKRPLSVEVRGLWRSAAAWSREL